VKYSFTKADRDRLMELFAIGRNIRKLTSKELAEYKNLRRKLGK